MKKTAGGNSIVPTPIRGDVAIGFDQGIVRVYDFSTHFSNIRTEELKEESKKQKDS